jgi:hypothetical protein
MLNAEIIVVCFTTSYFGLLLLTVSRMMHLNFYVVDVCSVIQEPPLKSSVRHVEVVNN